MIGYRARRYWRTVRHLSSSQVYHRVRRHLRRVLRRKSVSTCPSGTIPELEPGTRDRLAHYWAELLRLLHQHGVDTLPKDQQGCNVIFPARDFSWTPSRASKLDIYRLHSFAWLPRVASGLGPDAAPKLAAMMEDWIDANPPAAPIPWEPYPTSLRIAYWSVACAGLGVDSPKIRASLWQQLDMLADNVEFDVRANHVWWNAAALAVGGALMRHPVLPFALDLLEQEIREQVLADGCHYERSMMYHSHMLEAGLMAHAACASGHPHLAETLGRMANFLELVCHPDGEIPLFGDAALEEAITPPVLVPLARKILGQTPNQPALIPPDGKNTSGFFLFSGGGAGTHLIAKAGAPGPDYQLGHAHCDALSYELSLDGIRMIVDSGVDGYAESHFREYCRSTRAHNTVCVNDIEQLEFWSVFRVGRRYTVSNVWEGRDTFGNLTLSAEHNGFIHWTHARRFRFNPEDGRVFIQDEVRGPAPCRAQSFIHFHSGTTLEMLDGAWLARRNGCNLWIVPTDNTEIRVASSEEGKRQAWYFPRFGRALPAVALILTVQGGGEPLRFGYAIVPGETRPAPAEVELVLNDWTPCDV